MIQFSQVNKWYSSFQVLKQIDLDIRAGEKVVICGPSGSGKSTLLRCMNGLESYDQGDIFIDQQRINGPFDHKGQVGMVFQNFHLFPHLTVLENLTLSPIHTLNIPRQQAEETAITLLKRVHIVEQAQKYPSQLSGGQQQRVAIARALCMEPKILLFDEPTSALDPEMIGEVLDVMTELADDGMTMVCVTHEMGFAHSVADRIVFMDQGEILEVAAAKDFFQQAQHPRAQSFLQRILSHHFTS